MAVYKNVASQKVPVFMYDNTDGSAKTGDAANITGEISKDGAASAATNDANPTELDATDHPGVYLFDLTQAETNADLVIITPASTTANIDGRPIIIFTTPGDSTALDANVKEVSDDSTAADNLELACDNYSVTRGLAGTALPAAAADAAGGLVISDAGGKDFDAMHTAIGTDGTNLTEAGGTGDHLTAINLPNQTMDITGNITGNLSGSVGSVTGAVGSVTGHTAQTGDSYARLGAPAGASVSADIAAAKVDTAAILVDTAEIGAAGAGLSAVPWNATWDAEVQSEVDDALVAQKLDHLVAVADADDPVNNSIVAKMAASDGDWSGFSATTDALEAIADASTPPTAAAIADQVWEEAIADHSGTAGSTAEALDGASAPTAAAVADAVWDEANADHVAAGSTGKNLSDAGGGNVSVSYVIPNAALSLLSNSSSIAVTKYDTASITLTDLGSVTDKSATHFMVKLDKDDADADAKLHITEAGGLLILEGSAYGTAAHGDFTWDDTTDGDATITIQEQATGAMNVRANMHFAVKVVRSTGVVDTLAEGLFTVRDGIVQAIT